MTSADKLPNAEQQPLLIRHQIKFSQRPYSFYTSLNVFTLRDRELVSIGTSASVLYANQKGESPIVVFGVVR